MHYGVTGSAGVGDGISAYDSSMRFVRSSALGAFLQTFVSHLVSHLVQIDEVRDKVPNLSAIS